MQDGSVLHPAALTYVLRDLPPMVDELRAAYPGLTITVSAAVGENADVLNATPTDYVLLC